MYMIEEIEFYNKISCKDRTINFRLKDIFSDHWNSFLKNNPNLNIRPVVLKEVNKMISCRTSELGYSVYECPDCGEIKFSYHTCKSRFCPSCGNKYVRKRTEAILQKCYNPTFSVAKTKNHRFTQYFQGFAMFFSFHNV